MAVKCKQKIGFADEAKLHWVVRCPADGEDLQKDLIKMTECQKWGTRASV